MYKINKIVMMLAFFSSLVAGNLYAEDSKTSLTIYSNITPGSISPELYRPIVSDPLTVVNTIPGYAVVREERSMDLRVGENSIRFSDVAAFIDPTTVIFKSLSEPSTTVIDQDYHFDLVSNQKLLEQAVLLGGQIIMRSMKKDRMQIQGF